MTALEEGRDAKAREDWPAARAAYERAVLEEPIGEAYEGLARACNWLLDPNGAIAAMEKAYAAYRREGRPAQAALAALWICIRHLRSTGNSAAASGWASRCERLLQDAEAEPGPQLGWVILMRAVATQDWAAIEQAAQRAIEIARRFDDPDGELLAIAYSGLAQICTGRVPEGLERLDEAMAGASGGEVRTPDAAGQIFCVLMSGCERTIDLRRAEQWRRIVEPYIQTYEKHGFSGTCHTIFAGVLQAVGRWDEAERELRQALASFEVGAPPMRVDALVRLAGLRARQGRLHEAERLLEGHHDHADAQAPLAALELARGRPKVAAALLERRTRQLRDTDPQAAPLLLRLTEVWLAAGEAEQASQAAGRLRALADAAVIESVSGLAELASGWVELARGRTPVQEFERALDRLGRSGLAHEAAEARLALAESSASVNPELAAREARIAMDALAALGARPAVDRAAALLRRLGRGTPPGRRASAVLSIREREVARLIGLGLSNELIAGRLFLSPRTVEHHVTSILRKLDASKRTEIAAYAARDLSTRG